jgi:N-methylhydantoinase A
VVAASEILPEIREFERTSTGVLSGYVQPLISRYLQNLMQTLGQAGYQNDVLLVQSNGGVMSSSVSQRYSVNTILSGPAAGVNAALQLGLQLGEKNLISCDIGGTSLDVSVIVGGRPVTARETSLGYGLPIRIPMLDIRTMGAGGGSIAWIDSAGILNIGPESAGADPGPVCYDQGGRDPTVTDANLVLGRINPANPIGSDAGLRLNKLAAEKTIGEQIGRQLGLSVTAAAWAILQVTNHRIASSIRLLTIEQGRDPRDFTLMAFGGAGPLHAGALIRELEISRTIVPLWPGITSALGCLMADVRHDFVITINQLLEQLDPTQLYGIFQDHYQKGVTLIDQEGISVEKIEAYLTADMAYDGQIHEVRTPLPSTLNDREAIKKAFETSYAKQYGVNVENHAVRVLTLRTAVIGVRPLAQMPSIGSPPGTPIDKALKEHRSVFFEGGYQNCPVYNRTDLPLQSGFNGPAVIEQSDATTVIEPGMDVQVDDQGNLIISMRKNI